MRFAVFSDTHDNLFAVQDLIDELKKEKLDFAVHAGDIISPFTLREFAKLDVRIYFAFGNNDGDRKLLSGICSENNWEIGDIVEFPGGIVYHGTDPRIKSILSNIAETGKLVVFGHAHEPRIEQRGGGIVLNPGEVCGYLTGKRTYAIFEDGEINIIEM
jgi:hypothetical protein